MTVSFRSIREIMYSAGLKLVREVQLHPPFLSAVVAAILISFWYEPSEDLDHDFDLNRPIHIEGWICGPPETRKDCTYFKLSPLQLVQDRRPLTIGSRIEVYVYSTENPPGKHFEPHLSVGEKISFAATLKEPSYHAIPGVRDFRVAKQFTGYYYHASLKSPRQLQRKGVYAPARFLGIIFRYVQSFETYLAGQFDENEIALVQSFFLGRKSALDNLQKESIYTLGMAHFFVVSGFHLALIFFFLRLLIPFRGVIGLLICLSVAWFYILIIGLPVPATRAGLIVTIALGLFYFGFKTYFLNNLGLSAILIFCFAPGSLFLPGFQFSYLCVLAIDFLARPYLLSIYSVRLGILDVRTSSVLTGRSRDEKRRRAARFLLEENLTGLGLDSSRLFLRTFSFLWSYVLASLSLCLAIQFFLFPVLLFYMNRWSWAQLPSNLIFIPLFCGLVSCSFLLFCLFWTPLSGILCPVLVLLLDTTTWLIQKAVPVSPVSYLAHPSGFELGAYFFLLALICLLPRRRRLLWLACLPFLLLLQVSTGSSSGKRGDLQITMLDVGQGESIHLRYPDGTHALVDAGGSAAPGMDRFVGEQLIGRYLWYQRAGRLASVLLTHSERDHTGAFPFLARSFSIDRLYMAEPQTAPWTGPINVQQGFRFTKGGVSHLVLNPLHPALTSEKPNERSVVFLLRYRNFTMLFTGDISSKVERSLLPRLDQTTVLKVAHHGSRTSTSLEFLKTLQPAVALISCGRNNPFGHPSPEVVSRLTRASNNRTFSTADWGSLRILTDGYTFSVQHYSIKDSQFHDLIRELSVSRATSGAGSFR